MKHIYAVPTRDGNPECIQLIVGMWAEKEGLCGLLSSTGTSVLDVGAFACIGYDGELANYLAVNFWEPLMARRETAHLSAYLLGQAKKHARYCGGRSEICILALMNVLGTASK